MGNNPYRAIIVQLLTVALCLAAQAKGEAEPCCERIDGNRQVGFVDTQTVKLNEVFATLVVDSVRIRTNSDKRYAYLRVLAKTRVDTTLFADAFQFGSAPQTVNPGSLIEHDPSAFPDAHIDSLGGLALAAGDTLKHVFVLQVDPGNGRKEWHLSGIRCKFLMESNPPFPFSQALAGLNRFLDSVAVAAGWTTNKNRFRLGPLFLSTAWNIGFQAKAYHDGSYWFVNQLAGSGDCPAGCTEYAETVYRMDAQGHALIVSTRRILSLCGPTELIRRNETPPPAGKAAGCFTADGRQVDQNPSVRPARARILRSASPQ